MMYRIPDARRDEQRDDQSNDTNAKDDHRHGDEQLERRPTAFLFFRRRRGLLDEKAWSVFDGVRPRVSQRAGRVG